MGNEKLITLINERNEKMEVELICAFEISQNKYIIYTKNEKDREGNTVIYSGKIKEKDNNQYLINISDPNEWSKIKEVMREMARYSLEAENDDK